MRDSDYYPAGAYNDPNAPYNQCDTPDKEFEVTCTQVLSKSDVVISNNYTYESDQDEDGHWEHYDTSDICWNEEWHDNDHYTPLQLIQLFKKELEEKYNETSDTTSKGKAECRRLKHLIAECENWEEDELEYSKD